MFAPADYQQGDAFRILYIHPQTAYVGTRTYVVMAVAGGIGYVWRMKLAHAVAVSVAPIGASFRAGAGDRRDLGQADMGHLLAVGRSADHVRTLLLFLFLGYLALHASFEDRDKADRVSAILAVVGIVNVPIIHYSVEWWTTLHRAPRS